MVVYNEYMNINLKKKNWKLSGSCEVQSLRNTKCDNCGETKLCEIEYRKPSIEGYSYCMLACCQDCKKDICDTANVEVEKANKNAKP